MLATIPTVGATESPSDGSLLRSLPGRAQSASVVGEDAAAGASLVKDGNKQL